MGAKTYDIDGVAKTRFVEWLLTPPSEREPKALRDLATELRVSRNTLTTWKTRDKEFMEEWERRYLNSIGSPERKQAIMDTLYRTAIDPDDPKHVTAAKQYMEIEGSLKPQKQQIEITKAPNDLSDEELDALLAQNVTNIKDKREAS